MKTVITVILAYLAVISKAKPSSHGPSNSNGLNIWSGIVFEIFDRVDTNEATDAGNHSRGNSDALDEDPIFFDGFGPDLPVRDRATINTTEGSGDGQLHFPGRNTSSRGVAVDRTALTEEEGSGSFIYPSRGSSHGEVLNEEDSADWIPDKGNCTLETGYIIVNGTCERLLTIGLCAEGEWLVLRDNLTECVPRLCPFGELHYNGKCVNVSDVSVCNEGQILYVDFTGYTMCDCETGLIYDAWSGNCYAKHERGSCNFGQYLEVSEAGIVECVPNDCLLDNYVRDENFTGCYRKTYRGYCEPKFLITHHNNNTADCFTQTSVDDRNIYDVPVLRACPEGSVRSHVNECRERFRLPSLTADPSTFGNCKPGHIQGPGGTCRRIHRVLG